MGGGNRTVRTPKKRAALIVGLASGMTVSAACESAKVSKVTYYQWRKDDPGFNQECLDAIDAGVDLLEEEAVRRARAGSDLLMIFLLKGRRPDIYNRKVVVLEGNPEAPLQGNATVMIYPRDKKTP
jgi:hypothetical protein